MISFAKILRALDSLRNMSSLTIVAMVSGTAVSVFLLVSADGHKGMTAHPLCLSSICFLYAPFCKLPLGLAGAGCCFCLRAKADACALCSGRSLR